MASVDGEEAGETEQGIVGQRGPHGATDGAVLAHHLAAELRRALEKESAAVRDGNGNTYFPVDGFVIWQAAELREGHLSLSDQHI